MDMGVREDLERLRSAIEEARKEIGLWLDRLVGRDYLGGRVRD